VEAEGWCRRQWQVLAACLRLEQVWMANSSSEQKVEVLLRRGEYHWQRQQRVEVLLRRGEYHWQSEQRVEVVSRHWQFLWLGCEQNA